jgi:hypothetical protein
MGHVVRIRQVIVEKSLGKNNLGVIVINGRIILKIILKKQGVRMWIGLTGAG